MCLPPMIAAVGGIFSAATTVMQGQAQAKMYEAQAKMADANAHLAELQGAEEMRRGGREEKKLRQEAEAFHGSQRAQFGASGGQMSGSSLNVLSDTAQGIEEDAWALRFNTMLSKHGFDVNQVNFQNEASMNRASAKNAKTAGWIGGITGLLNTAGTVLGMTPVSQGKQADVNGGNITMNQQQSPMTQQAGGYKSFDQGMSYYDWKRDTY